MFQQKKWKRIEVVFELLVFGIVLGVIEDIIAIKIATGAEITWHTFGFAVLVAVPFAILGEVVFDKINFTPFLKKVFRKKF